MGWNRMGGISQGLWVGYLSMGYGEGVMSMSVERVIYFFRKGSCRVESVGFGALALGRRGRLKLGRSDLSEDDERAMLRMGA